LLSDFLSQPSPEVRRRQINLGCDGNGNIGSSPVSPCKDGSGKYAKRAEPPPIPRLFIVLLRRSAAWRQSRQAPSLRVGSQKNHTGDTPLQEKIAPRIKLKRDYYAGGLMLVLGVGAAVIGSGYKFGTLARMGPGFMPVMLGSVLAFLGLLIAGTALASSEPDDGKFLPDNPQWFGWLCILAGPALFIVLGIYAGMIPAVFACVFVCALGDKTGTYKSSAVLAAGVTVFGVLLFHYLLSIPFPLIRGVNL
jgi:hypothetical protein